MSRLEADILTDLTAVQDAKMKLLTGQSVKSLTVGSNDMQRRYSYNGVTIKTLNMELMRLQAELDSVTGADKDQCNEFQEARYSRIRIRGI